MNDILLTRTPPHSQDIEESVLSALFINPKGFEDVDGLTPEDFYKGAHKKIFSAMLSLRKRKEPVDLMTVAEELNANQELESVGGATYLVNISDTAPVALHVGQYAKRVMDLAKAREMISVASGIIESGMQAKDIEQYISDSQAKVLDIQTSTSKDQFFSMETLMQDALDRIEEAQIAEINMSLKFGMPKLDNYMQIWGSKLILLAGRPGMGKTSLAWSIAINLGYQGVPSGVLSIEMDKEQYADKALSGEADINSMIFYHQHKIDQTGFQKLVDAANLLSTLPITINDSESSLEDVKRRCRKFKKMGKQLIIIDQLSQISWDKKFGKYEGISNNCTAIKQLTKELRIPILLLCQLNRDLEKRENKRPTYADLAETGKLEQDADMILFLYREGVYNQNVDSSITEIILAKNRQGEKGTEHQVTFTKKRGMFQMVNF